MGSTFWIVPQKVVVKKIQAVLHKTFKIFTTTLWGTTVLALGKQVKAEALNSNVHHCYHRPRKNKLSNSFIANCVQVGRP